MPEQKKSPGEPEKLVAHLRQIKSVEGELALWHGLQSRWLKLGFRVNKPPVDWSAL
jgi:hypothetical protein